MTTSPREPGTVEAAVLGDIAALGTLRHGQATLAATALGLARQFDLLQDEKISRELRLVMSDLHALAAPAAPVIEEEKQIDSIDELKARRRKREAGGDAGA